MKKYKGYIEITLKLEMEGWFESEEEAKWYLFETPKFNIMPDWKFIDFDIPYYEVEKAS